MNCVVKKNRKTLKMGFSPFIYFKPIYMKKTGFWHPQKNGCSIWKPTFLHTPSFMGKKLRSVTHFGGFTPPPSTHTHTHTHREIPGVSRKFVLSESWITATNMYPSYLNFNHIEFNIWQSDLQSFRQIG